MAWGLDAGDRFIPAGAGNSHPGGAHRLGMSVHPRWRGEQSRVTWVRAQPGGSSPLARGTGAAKRRCAAPCRFIPAGAGNRRSPFRLAHRRAVHPRWRGEQMCQPWRDPQAGGSSPLARGTERKSRFGDGQKRFIPAGAGNSTALSLANSQASVHPRWRGEQCRQQRQCVAQVRFIPAGAGNRLCFTQVFRETPVHPRWRGEQN